MKFRKFKSAIAIGILSLGVGATTQTLSAAETVKLWVAPNAGQEAFWKVAVDDWNKSGNGMQVEFTTIPASGSSE